MPRLTGGFLRVVRAAAREDALHPEVVVAREPMRYRGLIAAGQPRQHPHGCVCTRRGAAWRPSSTLTTRMSVPRRRNGRRLSGPGIAPPRDADVTMVCVWSTPAKPIREQGGEKRAAGEKCGGLRHVRERTSRGHQRPLALRLRAVQPQSQQVIPSTEEASLDACVQIGAAVIVTRVEHWLAVDLFR